MATPCATQPKTAGQSCRAASTYTHRRREDERRSDLEIDASRLNPHYLTADGAVLTLETYSGWRVLQNLDRASCAKAEDDV